jgi:hypothetical protein
MGIAFFIGFRKGHKKASLGLSLTYGNLGGANIAGTGELFGTFYGRKGD